MVINLTGCYIYLMYSYLRQACAVHDTSYISFTDGRATVRENVAIFSCISSLNWNCFALLFLNDGPLSNLMYLTRHLSPASRLTRHRQLPFDWELPLCGTHLLLNALRSSKKTGEFSFCHWSSLVFSSHGRVTPVDSREVTWIEIVRWGPNVTGETSRQTD